MMIEPTGAIGKCHPKSTYLSNLCNFLPAEVVRQENLNIAHPLLLALHRKTSLSSAQQLIRCDSGKQSPVGHLSRRDAPAAAATRTCSSQDAVRATHSTERNRPRACSSLTPEPNALLSAAASACERQDAKTWTDVQRVSLCS